MTHYIPRPYQRDAIEEGLAYLTNPALVGRHGLIISPTGSGKSLEIAGIATRLPGPCVVFQPSREILEQNAAKLATYGYRPAVFSASFNRREIGAITLATIGSVVNHAEAFTDIPYVLIDECHEAINPKGGQWTDFLGVLRPDVRILGFSISGDAMVELQGNVFGAGFVGRLDEAFNNAAISHEVAQDGDLEIIELSCVYARGFNGRCFSWRPLRSLIRHHHRDKLQRIVTRGQISLSTTLSHSIYSACAGERVRRYPATTNRTRCARAKVVCSRAADLCAGDVLVADDGASWERCDEDVINMVEFAARWMGRSRIRVICNAASVEFPMLVAVASGRRPRAMARRWIASRSIPLSVYLLLGSCAPKAEQLTAEGSSHSIAASFRLSDWAYMLGFYLGDGWLSKDAIGSIGTVGFAVENSRISQFVRQMNDLAWATWTVSPQCNHGSGSTEVRARSVFVYSVIQRLCGKVSCDQKRIPGEWIISWPRPARVALLQGLLDSDGYSAIREDGDHRCSRLTTTSLALADTTISLLRSLGVVASRHHTAPSGKGGFVDGRRYIVGKLVRYDVTWSTYALQGDSSGHHGHRSRYLHHDLSFVESVVRSSSAVSYDGYIYDIAMDGHPSFVANGILVHNTATPFRLASNSFGSELRFLTRTKPRIFTDVVHCTQTGDLFRDGYLCPLDYRSVPIINRERLTLNSTGADYTDASVQRLFGEVGFVGQLQQEVERELAAGRQHILVFTRFVQEAERLARAVPGTAVVTAETPSTARANIIAAFRAGRIRVCANVGVLLLGFDFPALDCVILARPTVSLSIHYQQIGRSVRPHPQKPRAYVVDLVGLVDQFGKMEDLIIRPGGVKGQQWVVCEKDRPLTNTYFQQRDQVDPSAAMKALKKRRFWARRARFAKA